MVYAATPKHPGGMKEYIIEEFVENIIDQQNTKHTYWYWINKFQNISIDISI